MGSWAAWVGAGAGTAGAGVASLRGRAQLRGQNTRTRAGLTSPDAAAAATGRWDFPEAQGGAAYLMHPR